MFKKVRRLTFAQLWLCVFFFLSAAKTVLFFPFVTQRRKNKQTNKRTNQRTNERTMEKLGKSLKTWLIVCLEPNSRGNKKKKSFSSEPSKCILHSAIWTNGLINQIHFGCVNKNNLKCIDSVEFLAQVETRNTFECSVHLILKVWIKTAIAE